MCLAHKLNKNEQIICLVILQIEQHQERTTDLISKYKYTEVKKYKYANLSEFNRD